MEQSHRGGAHSSIAAIQATSDDATTIKLWCVNKGYIKDDHVHFFRQKSNKATRIVELPPVELKPSDVCVKILASPINPSGINQIKVYIQ